MCMMIRGAADRPWWMKTWCVQLKRRSERIDNSPLRHFPCIFLKFHSHFLKKLCLINLSFGNCVHAGAEDAYGRTQIETAGQCVGLSDMIQWGRPYLLEPCSHRGRDMGVARNLWIEAAIHEVEAHFIANKDEIHSAQCFGTEKAFCLWTSYLKASHSTQVSIVTHLKNCVTRSSISNVACLSGMLWWFMTTPVHTLLPQRKISSQHLAGNNLIIPPAAQT